MNGIFEETYKYVSEEVLEAKRFRNKMKEVSCVTCNIFIALGRNLMGSFVLLSKQAVFVKILR